jgi:hypothetical protein
MTRHATLPRREISPYAVISGYQSRGHEHTSKVDLKSESVFGVQASTGPRRTYAGVRLGAEYNVARVRGYSLKFATEYDTHCSSRGGGIRAPSRVGRED